MSFFTLGTGTTYHTSAGFGLFINEPLSTVWMLAHTHLTLCEQVHNNYRVVHLDSQTGIRTLLERGSSGCFLRQTAMFLFSPEHPRHAYLLQSKIVFVRDGFYAKEKKELEIRLSCIKITGLWQIHPQNELSYRPKFNCLVSSSPFDSLPSFLTMWEANPTFLFKLCHHQQNEYIHCPVLKIATKA